MSVRNIDAVDMLLFFSIWISKQSVAGFLWKEKKPHLFK